ncbi:glycoside hydrolase family 95-like protein [Adhaeretor mobilis]|uniref:Alpha fucosidase A-like C-terminal domain-containing protein n=1 Tax=Adhaeretor mobilis TaxID=1930276 RepID=A0A517MX43_9BACT|nr:hypothetical protein [Adhaeretor mobilis]QDS99450.1 hypothetical protein HG15A2_27730 [Adhaeretor mobilis]
MSPVAGYRSVIARGNFEVSAQWAGGQASRLEVLSKVGAPLTLRYPNVAQAVIQTTAGQPVNFVDQGRDEARIQTLEGQTYVVIDIPAYCPVAAPSNLKIKRNGQSDQIDLSWSGNADAASYNLYRAVGNAPNCELIASGIKDSNFVFNASDLNQIQQMTSKSYRSAGRWAREQRRGYGDLAAALTRRCAANQEYQKQKR